MRAVSARLVCARISTKSNLNPGNLPKKGVKYFDDTDWNWIVTGRQENREKVWQVLKGK